MDLAKWHNMKPCVDDLKLFSKWKRLVNQDIFLWSEALKFHGEKLWNMLELWFQLQYLCTECQCHLNNWPDLGNDHSGYQLHNKLSARQAFLFIFTSFGRKITQAFHQ